MKLADIKEFPILKTDRLILRSLSSEDEPVILSIQSDEKNNTYINREVPRTLNDARKFIKNMKDGFKFRRWLYWGISMKELPILVGTICLWNFKEDINQAEIGYEMHPDFQGRGVMQEAVTKVLEYGFHTLKLKNIVAFTHQGNVKSIRVLERNGFEYLRKATEDKGDREFDFVVYGKEP